MIFKFDGRDMLPFIAEEGLAWEYFDVDGPNAGRTMDAEMHRELVATKIKWKVTCIPLSHEDVSIVMNAIHKEYIEVEAVDPMYGHTFKQMYCSNAPAIYIDTHTDMWKGVTFSITER